jgi:hypothetical protein
MLKPFGIDGGINGEGLVGIHQRVPLEIKKFVVKSVFVPRFEAENWHKDFECRSARVIDFVKKAKVALADYGSVFDLHISPTEFLNFLGENFLQPKKGLDLYAEIFCIHSAKIMKK